jgi:hypothetical protein
MKRKFAINAVGDHKSRLFKSLFLSVALSGLLFSATNVVAGSQVTLEQPVHFIGVDGSEARLSAGTYSVEAGETWLRLIPGERRNAMLVEAEGIVHQEVVVETTARLNSVNDDLQEIVLLLPDGTGLKAVGTRSGVISRGLLPRRQRNRLLAPRAPQTSTRQDIQRIQRMSPAIVDKKKKKEFLIPSDPWAKTLVALIQQMGKRVKSLEAEVEKLKKHKHRHGRTSTGSGGNQWINIRQLRKMQDDESEHSDDYGIYFRSSANSEASSFYTEEPKY